MALGHRGIMASWHHGIEIAVPISPVPIPSGSGVTRGHLQTQSTFRCATALFVAASRRRARQIQRHHGFKGGVEGVAVCKGRTR